MEYYNNSFVDVRIYVKRLPWFWFMRQALYNTLTCNLLLRIKAVAQIRKIVLRTESKSLSGAYKNDAKTGSTDAEKQNARGFFKEILQRDRSINNFFCFVFITLLPKKKKNQKVLEKPCKII